MGDKRLYYLYKIGDFDLINKSDIRFYSDSDRGYTCTYIVFIKDDDNTKRYTIVRFYCCDSTDYEDSWSIIEDLWCDTYDEFVESVKTEWLKDKLIYEI